MGKLIGGPFGMIRGRVGNLVGYVLNGENIMRKIGKSSKPLTPARKANCQKMTVVNQFLSPALDFLRSGFRLEVAGTNRNAYNEAVSYNKMNAIQGEYPNFSLDYSKVLISKGSLPVAEDVQIKRTEDGLMFTWDTADTCSQRDHDRAMLMVFFPKDKTINYHLIGSKRAEGKDVLYIDPDHRNEHMEAYISFIRPDGTQISDSVYAGSLAAVQEQTAQTEPEAKEIKPADSKPGRTLSAEKTVQQAMDTSGKNIAPS